MNTFRTISTRQSTLFFLAISLLVLMVSLFYSYAAIFLTPFSGIFFAGDWIVQEISTCPIENNQCPIQIGDQLLQIGSLTKERYQQDRTLVAFAGVAPGQSVIIKFQRGETLPQTIVWQMPPPIIDWWSTIWSALIYLPFWIAGTGILLLLRPHDLRWLLLILFNYVTTLWLATGIVSYLHVAHSVLLSHALAWMLIPIYIHLHLIVPSPILPRVRRYVLLPVLYTGSLLLAILELFQIPPNEAFYLSFLLSIGGSFALIILRLTHKPSASDRIALRLMLTGIGLGFGLGLVLVVLPSIFGVSDYTSLIPNVSIFAIPLLPAFYIYAIYKRHLGNLEFRANRILSIYGSILIYATAFLIIFSASSPWLKTSDQTILVSLFFFAAFSIMAFAFGPRFQRWINRLAYGSAYDSEEIVRAFANRIPAALDRDALAKLLTSEILPSLFIRESALYLWHPTEPKCFYTNGISCSNTPHLPAEFNKLSEHFGQYHLPTTLRQSEFDWVRLALELKVGKERVGIWLLGRRDPDDFYPQSDIMLLNTLANQIAPALDNIRLFEETRAAAHQFGLLYAAGLSLNRLREPHAQMESLAQTAMQALHADRAEFTTYDKARNELRFEIGIGFAPDILEKLYTLQSIPGEERGLIGWIAQTRKPLNIPDVQTDPRWIPLDPTIRSALWTTIERKQELRGILGIFSTHTYAFTAQDEQLLGLFANQAAIALENARLFEAEQTRRTELDALFDLSRAIADVAFDFDAILNLITRRAVETIHVTFARVVLLEGNDFIVRAAHSIRGFDIDLQIGHREPTNSHPLYKRVLSQNEMLVLNANSPEATSAEFQTICLRVAQTICLIPLPAGDHGLGLLILGEVRGTEREPFAAEKLHLANSIGALAISTLQRAGLYNDLERAYLETVTALAMAVDAKDTYTADHAQQLSDMALAIGKEMEMSPQELDDLRFGAILHDVGKIGVPDAILLKPGKLEDDEWNKMREHPLIGAHILEPVTRLARASLIVRHHHERYDGRGYPGRLVGENIPLGARILTVVDSYSAIMDRRPYKEPHSHQEALAEIKRCTGEQFDPRVVQVFLQLFETPH